MNLAENNKIYNFDASALIVLSHNYPIKRFSPLWLEIEELFNLGRAYVVREVYEEVMNKDDDMAGWIKERQTQVVKELSADDYNQAISIIRAHPTLEDENRVKTIADPYVIAHSLNHKTVVVTAERSVSSGKNNKKAKIPIIIL